ncbi:hypothetical protein [Candidatus Brachybacter algidus]|nr:hypothetical protein [Candidatus Brachybacter algidus]MBK6450127.1 hypothetical protein [Candidatus Brachybacter algidus]
MVDDKHNLIVQTQATNTNDGKALQSSHAGQTKFAVTKRRCPDGTCR